MMRRVLLVAIIENNGEYLFTEQSEGIHQGYWGFPGGTVEEQDTSLEERLETEVAEEVGLTVVQEEYLGSYTAFVKEDDLHVVWVFFRVDVDNTRVSLGSEISQYKWLTLDDLISFP